MAETSKLVLKLLFFHSGLMQPVPGALLLPAGMLLGCSSQLHGFAA